MSRQWILTALGKDRPGIVAGVTKRLFDLGCNLEDSAMTRLAGEFTIMLMFSAPGRLTRASLERAFASLSKPFQLVIHLKLLTRAETAAVRRGEPYLVSVYGADRPGIVYHISKLLADSRINITDVSTHRTSRPTGRKGPSLYLMLLEIELPAGGTTTALERRLRALAKKLGVEVSLRSAETQVL